MKELTGSSPGLEVRKEELFESLFLRPAQCLPDM